MKKYIVILGCILFILIFGGCGNIKLKESFIRIELGEKTSIEVSDILDIDEKEEKEVSINTKNVDFKKAGVYKATATYQKKVYDFEVKIVDTTKPEVKLKEDGDCYMVVGGELSSEEILEEIYDASGISSISFKENGVQKEENELVAYVVYDQTGTYENQIIVIDNNGNETSEKLTIIVVEDFSDKITVDDQIIIIQGGSVDWNAIVDYDAEKYEIMTDSVSVDTNALGEYKVIYEITQKETGVKIKKEVPVIVKEEVLVEAGSGNNSNNGNGNPTNQTNNAANTGGGGTTSKSSGTSGSSSNKSGGTGASSGSSNKSGGTSGSGSASSNTNNTSGNNSSNTNSTGGSSSSSSSGSASSGSSGTGKDTGKYLGENNSGGSDYGNSGTGKPPWE